jgi:hypothetical protein
MSRSLRNRLCAGAFFVLALSLVSGTAMAVCGQSYEATTLVKNTGKTGDKQLINPWGLAASPSSPFWLSDEGTGLSTLYTGTGAKQSLVVTIPTAAGTGVGTPTGIVYNGSTEFQIDTWTSAFLFATLDGTISGWSHFDPNNALIGVKNSSSGAVYTGLAITSHSSGNFLYAADVANNKVDVYDGKFKFDVVHRYEAAGGLCPVWNSGYRRPGVCCFRFDERQVWWIHRHLYGGWRIREDIDSWETAQSAVGIRGRAFELWSAQRDAADQQQHQLGNHQRI